MDSYMQRSLSFWFNVEDTQSTERQVIYEEGDHFDGLNLYVFEGSLYVGGWNYPSSSPDSGWRGTYVSSSSIEPGTWHHVALVLDAKDLPHARNTKSMDTFKAYLDGRLIGTGEGSMLRPHDSQYGTSISLGAMLTASRFHCTDDEEQQDLCSCPDDAESCSLPIRPHPWGPPKDYFFEGLIDEGRVYNRALSQAEVALLAADADRDGISDADDNCPGIPNDGQEDSDEDGVGDACDNCVEVANADQWDTNAEGFGNMCDADYDDDGCVDWPDFGILFGAWGCTTGQACYDEELDMEPDGAIGWAEFGLFWNQRGGPPGPSAFATGTCGP
jgi:hypothetical protein